MSLYDMTREEVQELTDWFEGTATTSSTFFLEAIIETINRYGTKATVAESLIVAAEMIAMATLHEEFSETKPGKWAQKQREEIIGLERLCKHLEPAIIEVGP